MLVTAQLTKSIHVSTAGTLATLLTPTEKLTINNLTITGSINAIDFQTMRDNMPAISILDLSAVNIAAYNDMWNPIPANEIPESAFSFFDINKKYSNLTSIILPLTLTKIERNAFNSCSGLLNVDIPVGVSIIGNGAFWGCTTLHAVVIPSTATTIDDVAFAGCTALQSITVKATTPITFGLYVTPFTGVNKSTCTLYVPAGTLNAYKAADQWKDFLNIVELTTTQTYSVAKHEILLYPNPATDFICFAGMDKDTQIDIYSITGKHIKSYHLNQGANSIDVSAYPKGIYLINGVSEDEKWMGRFVKE